MGDTMKEGQVWVLNDGKEYIIVNMLNVMKNTYVMLLTEEKPAELKLGKIIYEDGETKFKPTTDREQALYILESMIHSS